MKSIFVAVRKIFEKVDDRPVALPVNMKPPTEVDRMREMMRRLIVEVSQNPQRESFEESLDFRDDEDEEVVSPSETRYMKEERLLTEAEEASKVVMQRRAAYNWRKKHGQDDGRGKRVERSGSEAVDQRAGDEREKRGEVGREGRAAGDRSGGVSEGDQRDRAASA